MTVTLQNLRAVGAGVEPSSLLPGQLAFNVTDKIVFVGDGSSTKTSFNGVVSGGTAGGGWYAMPMDYESLNSYFLTNPELYGDYPTNNQVITWSTNLNRPIWTSGGTAGSSQVYTTTNAAVVLAPGATTSDKISTAIGVASPDKGNSVIVTGVSGDLYQGLYLFTTSWIRAAYYAWPVAQQIYYDHTISGLSAVTVQQAIDETSGQSEAAQTTANAALPRTGGTMTGFISFKTGQTITGGTF
jgi:hypothetical protein